MRLFPTRASVRNYFLCWQATNLVRFITALAYWSSWHYWEGRPFRISVLFEVGKDPIFSHYWSPKWQGIKTVKQKPEKNLDGTEMRSKSESEMTLKTEGGEWGTCNSGKRDEIWAIIWAILRWGKIGKTSKSFNLLRAEFCMRWWGEGNQKRGQAIHHVLTSAGMETYKNIARIANAVQVTICLLVSTSVY